MWTILAIIGWAFCGILGYGITFAYFQNKYPTIANDQWGEDAGFACFIAVIGPVGLIISLLATGFCKYGWRLK